MYISLFSQAKMKRNRNVRKILGVVVAMSILFFSIERDAVPLVIASSFSPTILVNTEAFMTVDDSDSTANVSIRFGDTLAKTITYNRTTARFEFNDSVSVTGNLRVSGTASGQDIYATRSFTGANIYATTTLGGAGLTSCSNTTNDKLLWNSATKQFSCGTDQGGAGSGLSQSAGDARYVNTSGDTMTGALTISNAAGLNASGAILTNGNATLNSDNGAADATLTFGNATLAQTIKYSHANQRFEFSKDIRVTGSITAVGALSGTTLNVSGIAGNTFVLDGNSVVFDATNNRFGIGTSSPETTLEVVGSMSGRLIRAQNRLESSGSLLVGGAMINKPSTTQAISAAGNSILANATMVVVDPNADYTMTSTPTIADGSPGQVLIVTASNSETNKVIVQDQDTLGSSNLQLGTTAREITGKKTLTLVFDGTDWVEQAYTTESMDVQTFTATGANTWTKPTGAKAVYVICVGAGGGGGGGTGGAAGTARIGGGGGGGGATADKWLLPANLSGTVTVTVGAGGNGGLTGANGTAGGSSTFGSNLTCYGGGYGKGGVAAAISAGGGGGGTGGVGSNGASATNVGGLPAATAGANGIAGQGGGGNIGTNNGMAEYGGGGGNGSSATPGAAGNGGSSLYGAGGGGGGGGITTGNAAQTAGAGGNVGVYTTGGGSTAGTSSATCTVGANGTPGNSTKMGTGGAGGGSDTDSTGCNGGTGGALGGGGGGGGGGTTTGGVGGKGGRGEIRVYTFF
jgi:hypothetical protein